MCLKDVCKIKNIKCLIRMGVVRYPPITDFITHKNLLFGLEHMIMLGVHHMLKFIEVYNLLMAAFCNVCKVF